MSFLKNIKENIKMRNEIEENRTYLLTYFEKMEKLLHNYEFEERLIENTKNKNYNLYHTTLSYREKLRDKYLFELTKMVANFNKNICSKCEAHNYLCRFENTTDISTEKLRFRQIILDISEKQQELSDIIHKIEPKLTRVYDSDLGDLILENKLVYNSDILIRIMALNKEAEEKIKKDIIENPEKYDNALN